MQRSTVKRKHKMLLTRIKMESAKKQKKKKKMESVDSSCEKCRVEDVAFLINENILWLKGKMYTTI